MEEYFLTISVPANTSSSSPVEEEIEVEGDYVYEVAYLIPSGHVALTGLRIFYGDLQLLPRNRDEWVKGDNVYRSVKVRWNFRSRKIELTFRAYNEDDTYDHTFYVWIVTADRSEVLMFERLERLLSAFVAFIRRLGGF